MTHYEKPPIYCDMRARKSWLGLPALRLLIAGVYFMLGLSCKKTCEPEATHDYEIAQPSRLDRRLIARDSRRPVPAARDFSALRALMPGGASASEALSRNQFLERCTKLSAMGRLQIYNFKYYRNDFCRMSAVQHLGETLGANTSNTPPSAKINGAQERVIPP